MNSCGNCLYFSANVHCTRFPPTAVAPELTSWPRVLASDWCGEWHTTYPASVTSYTPNPFVMPGSGTINGTGLMAVSIVMFGDINLNTTYQCTITSHTDTSIGISQAQTHLSGMYLYLTNASYVQVADMIPLNTA